MADFKHAESFTVVHCGNCNMAFALNDAYVRRRRDDHKTWYCPEGHGNYYSGKSEAEKLRVQLEQTEHQRDRARPAPRKHAKTATRSRRLTGRCAFAL